MQSNTEYGLTINCDHDFQLELSKTEKLLLVCFCSNWCTPCEKIHPILHRIEQEMNEQVKILVIDPDETPHTAIQFKVAGLPTCLLIKDQQTLARIQGIPTIQELREYIHMASTQTIPSQWGGDLKGVRSDLV